MHGDQVSMINQFNRGKILYIEDNADNRLLMRRILSADGYQVFEAANATEALQDLKSLKPDLIMMDINMPEMDGYTLTALIRSMPDLHLVPIIAITANVLKGDRERSLEAGCDGYIQKPIDIDAIGSQIDKFIKR